jgi:hypothetical protein
VNIPETLRRVLPPEHSGEANGATYRRLTCTAEPEFRDWTSMRTHLVSVHKVSFPASGTRQFRAHFNRGKVHDTVYECELAGIKFLEWNSVRMGRRRE